MEELDDEIPALVFNFLTADRTSWVGRLEVRVLSFLPRAPPLDLDGTVVEETVRFSSSSQADKMSSAT